MSNGDVRAAVTAALATALGACALTPVFSSPGWVLPVLAAILVVLAGGLLFRLGAPVVWARATHGRPVPGRLAAAGVALVPVGQLALVLCLLTARYAPGKALAGVIPTRGSLARLGEVLAGGTREVQEQATPALPLTGLVALTVMFVAMLAVVVDLVAVAGRQAALAGVGLLLLYSVPVATVTGGVGLVAVAAPAAGLALLLWTDQRRRLGTTAARASRPTLGTGTVAAFRVGAAAILTGLVLGSLVPTLSEGSFATGLGGGSGGGATGSALDPVAEMRGQLKLPDPIDLLRVDASVQQPGYLRAVSLEDYDTRSGWTMSNLTGETSVAGDSRLAPPLPGQPIRQVRATIQVLQHDDRFLPVLSFPLSVRMEGARAWRFDPVADTVYGRGVTTGGRSYTVVADEPRPTPEILAQAQPLPADDPVQKRFTLLPPQLNASVLDTVATLIGDATAPYERVRRIHTFLTDRGNGFRYSLSTEPGTSGDDLVDFLQLRRGYCEQYAGAMAVMVRAAGVPARVVLGYTAGRTQTDGTRLITSDDAHAWVEAYFQDLGWVPFDPTPIAGDRAAEMPWALRGDAGTDEQQLDGPAAAAPTQAGPTTRRDRAGDAAATAAPGSSSDGTSWPVVTGILAVVLALALLGTPAVVRLAQRRRRVATGSAAALWDELTATARDVDVRMQPTWTPRRAGQELTAVLAGAGGPPDGAGAGAVRRLALAEEAASYGPAGGNAVHPDLVLALRTARHGLLAAAPRPVRWRARLWPASVVTGAAGRLAAGILRRLPARRPLRRGPRAV